MTDHYNCTIPIDYGVEMTVVIRKTEMWKSKTNVRLKEGSRETTKREKSKNL
jgi:hypothetical protein